MLNSFRGLSNCSLLTALRRNGKAATSFQLQKKDVRNYETLSVNTVAPHVTHVEINRPNKMNAMNKIFWDVRSDFRNPFVRIFFRECRECFAEIHEDSKCRAVVFSGAGKIFTAGLDFSDMGDLVAVMQSEEDLARKGKKIYNMIRDYQNSFSALETCSKPVIAAIHSACIGAGVDVISAADIRYCTSDAWFQVKEVDIGLAADVGTLQRLPRIVGNESLVRELAYSARKMQADEAASCGLVSRVFPDKSSMIDASIEMASTIASKSPVAVQGTKMNLIYSRDHGVEEGLQYQAIWNSAMLQSEDLMKSVMAQMNKEPPTYSDL